MTFFSRLLHRPRDLFLRRALYFVHLWTGLLVGLFAIMIGITGSYLVVRDDIADWPVRHALHADLQPNVPSLTADEIAAAVQRELPGRLTSLTLPAEPGESIQGVVGQKAESTWFAMHPQTGKILATRSGDGVGQWIKTLHANLLAGKTGRLWVGIGGVAMIIMCLTGIFIWWQGTAKWKLGTRVRRDVPWKRKNWELHGAVGFWGFVLFLMWSVTGANFTWPDLLRTTVSAISPTRRNAPPKITRPEGAKPLPLSQQLAAAEAAVPGHRVRRIRLADKTAATQFNLPEGDPADTRRSNTVFVNPHTAQVVSRDLYADRSFGDHVLTSLKPAHYGTFANGSPVEWAVKIAWVLGGLLLPVLFITGFIMWLNRSVIPPLRRRFRQPVPATVEESELAPPSLV